jgi:hypothetical protein
MSPRAKPRKAARVQGKAGNARKPQRSLKRHLKRTLKRTLKRNSPVTAAAPLYWPDNACAKVTKRRAVAPRTIRKASPAGGA